MGWTNKDGADGVARVGVRNRVRRRAGCAVGRPLPGDGADRPDDATDRVSGVWHPLLRRRIAEAGAGAHLSENTDRGYRTGTRPRAGSPAGVEPGRDSLRSERSPRRRHPGRGIRVEPGTREHRTGKVGHHATGASAGELDPDEAGPALAIDPLRSRVTMTSRVDEFISGRPAAWSSARSSA